MTDRDPLARMKSWKEMGYDGRSSFTYDAAPKGRVAVFMMLGTEPLTVTDENKHELIDPLAELEKMGWKYVGKEEAMR